MNINWQEIKDKYPKAFQSFIKYYKNYFDYKIDDSLYNIWIKTKLEKICFCDILKFFDSVGIIIFIFSCNPTKYDFDIEVNWNPIFESFEVYNSREEAQDAATIKAFSILNSMIEKGEIE